jgi:hypothetical protein
LEQKRVARWAPCKRDEFIRKLRKLGFSGPEPGGKHAHLRYGRYTLTLPNNPEYSVHQVKTLLQQIAPVLGRKLSLQEWQKL